MREFDGVGFFPREQFSRDFVARRISHYFALVTQIDAAVGRIMERVNLSDTLVVFTSDHGVYLGRRGRVDKHPFLALEDVGRVPFFACGPGVPEGVRVAHPVGLVDLAPTFLAAAGAESLMIVSKADTTR